MLGEWVRRRGIREEMVIIDKGAHTRAGQKRLTPADITADLHEGLSRLGTDYIDLYLLHRDDPAMGVGPIVEVLNEYLSAGRIRAFGGSDWTGWPDYRGQRLRRRPRTAWWVSPPAAPNLSLAVPRQVPWAGGCLIAEYLRPFVHLTAMVGRVSIGA